MAGEGRERCAYNKKGGEAFGYSPMATGCRAVELALDELYADGSEDNFWSLISAIHYAMQMETRVLAPLNTAPVIGGSSVNWLANPLPEDKAADLQPWLVRENNGRLWMPLFTSAEMAAANSATANMPMTSRLMADCMEYALKAEDITGMVLNPWTRSAALDDNLLKGFLFSVGESSPGDDILEEAAVAAAGKDWDTAIQKYKQAAAVGNAEAYTRLGECFYYGRGAKKNRGEAIKIWKKCASAGEISAMLCLGDACANDGSAGEALMYYRQAQKRSDRQADITYTPKVCLRIAQAEAQYVAGEHMRAAALAAEAVHGLQILARDGDCDAALLLDEARELTAKLAGEPGPCSAY